MSKNLRRTAIRLALIATVAVLPLLLLTPAGAPIARPTAGMGAVLGHDFTPPVSLGRLAAIQLAALHAAHRDIPGGSGIVQYLASHGNGALFSYLLASDGSTEIAFWNATTNTITKVQNLGNGPLTFMNGLFWAGDRYVFAVYDASSGTTSWETYSTGFGITLVSTPLPVTADWTLVGVAGGYLFVSGSSDLYALNESSFAIANDFGPLLPTGASISAVDLQAGRLYLGGSIVPVSGGSYALYGYLDLIANTFVQLSPTEVYPSYYGTSVYSITVAAGNVYFAGGAVILQTSPTFLFYTVGSVFESYDPTTSTVTNLSSLLPPAAAADQVLILHGQVGVVSAFFNDSSLTLTIRPGFFILHPTTATVTNDTSKVGKNFGVLVDESSVSANSLFMGGEDLLNGETEVAHFPVSEFVS